MYQYSGSITSSTPQTSGQFAFYQSGFPLSTTAIYFNYTYFTQTIGDATGWLSQLTNSTNPIKGRLRISINGTQNTFVDFNINETYTTTSSGPTLTYIIPVFTVISNNLPSLAINDICTVSFAFAGDIGSASLPPATISGQYLVWDGSTWVVGSSNISIGGNAGSNSQNLNAVALGYQAGQYTQGTYSVAIGYQAGQNSQGTQSIAIGYQAGQISQTGDGIAIGTNAGYNTQGYRSIAIGSSAGYKSQGARSIAIGESAGGTEQGNISIAIGYYAGSSQQQTNAISIGSQAGARSQGGFSVAIGTNAGFFSQAVSSVAVGQGAGYSRQSIGAIAIGGQLNPTIVNEGGAGGWSQGSYAVSIGIAAGFSQQGVGSIAIGREAGGYSQAENSVAIGYQAGLTLQGSASVAIGYQAGYSQQGSQSIAIGYQAGSTQQSTGSIAIGYQAGAYTQSSQSIAIGNQAGQSQQGAASVAIGYQAGTYSQSANAVAVGFQAGYFSQQTQAIAIGYQAGQTQQGFGSIAIGYQAGQTGQGSESIAMGYQAGFSLQATQCVSIGYQAGYSQQGTQSVAIGYQAGSTKQGQQSVAIGQNAGQFTQGDSAVTIGQQSGQYSQGASAIAIGQRAGQNTQATGAIAIGSLAGQSTQGTYSIAIGVQSGQTSQHQNSIILNATGAVLNSQTQSAFYVAPIRQASAANTLYYDSTTDEIVYEGAPTIETMNFSNFGQTSKLNSVPYASNQQITTSNISAKLDNFTDNGQTYTFGPTVQARYVAVGTDGAATAAKTINYSADGLNWIAATSPFNTAGGYCNGIAYNGTVWVAVGSNVAVTSAPTVTVAYSYDGITWINASGTTFNGTTGGVAFGVAWGKDKFVAVGCSASATPVTNTSIYSYDGINWLAASNNIFGTGSGSVGYGVCFNGLRWVVVGGQSVAGSIPSAIVGYSANGITWTSGSGTTLQAGGAFRSVAWNGKIFVMVGALAALTPGTTAYISQDGITWSSTTTSGTNVFGSASGASGFGVCWNGQRWVAVGRNTNTGAVTLTINYSTNGLIWTTVSTNVNFNGVGGVGSAVCWTGTKFIAVGRNVNSGPPSYTVLYSYDGISWLYPLSGATIPSQGNPFSTTGVNGGLGYGIAFNSVRPNQITFPINIVVATGGYVTGGAGNLSSTNIYSIDGGLTWLAGTSIFGTSPSSTIGGYCVAYNGKIWLAGGTNLATPTVTLAYSFDGIVWTAVPNFTSNIMGNLPSGVCRGIAWSPTLNMWVAVGLGSGTPTNGTFQLAYSYDGINWVGVSSVTFAGNIGSCVIWGKDRFIAGGGNTTTGNKIYYSTNGKTWTVATSVFNTGYNGIAYNGTMYVAVGQNALNGVAYSYDGINWTLGATAIFASNGATGAVAWSPPLNRWVAGGNGATNSIYYSTDGINWTGSTGGPVAGPVAIYSVTWSGNRFVAGGGTPVSLQQYTSTDGINWSVNPTTTMTFCAGLAWSSYQVNTGQQLTNVYIQQPTLALGAGTNTIAISYNGISWRGLGKTIFTTSGQGACWNGKIWVAGGISASVGVIAYSYDGINWTIATQSIFTSAVYSIAWNGTVFVAGGQGTTYVMAYSYDGINWTGSATRSSVAMSLARNVKWEQNYFVAVGATSTYSVVGGFAATGTTVTISSANETLAIGQLLTVSGSNPGTYITGQLTGTPGGAGTYSVNNTVTIGATVIGATYGYYNAATFTGSISATTLTVSAVTGTVSIGQLVYGGTVTANTYITAGSGSTWTVSISQTSTATGSAGGGAAYSTDGINWTGITSAYVYNGGGYNSVIFADNRWIIYSSIGSTTYVLYASSLIALNPWTYVLLIGTTSSPYGITYGIYPVSSAAAGTTYGTILVIGASNSSGIGYFYSTNSGTSWNSVSASATQCVAWNGKKFLLGLQSVDIKYATNPTASANFISIANPTAVQLFTSVNAFGVSTWPTLGSIYVDNALTLSSNSGINTNNQLDIYSDTYFNNGYNNMALTVKSIQIP